VSALKPVAQPDPHEEAAREWLKDQGLNPDAAVGRDEDGYIVRSNTLAALLREREAAAERRGAEGMRKEAAYRISQQQPPGDFDGAAVIRAIPLPKAPVHEHEKEK